MHESESSESGHTVFGRRSDATVQELAFEAFRRRAGRTPASRATRSTRR